MLPQLATMEAQLASLSISKKRKTLTSLSPELIIDIASYLPLKSLAALSRFRKLSGRAS